MTLDKIGWIIGQFVNFDKYSEEFDTLLNFAQNLHFANNVDNEEIIYPFIKHKGLDNGTLPLVVNSLGLATLPSDFAKHKDFTFLYNGGQEQIEMVNQWEFSHRKTQAIEYPTRHYPIGCYFGSYIKFLPTNLQFVNYTYLAKPADIHYATKSENGMLVYDPINSIELSWDEQNQVEIVKLFLQELGVIVSTEQIKSKINQK
jgi:hypothetical protein